MMSRLYRRWITMPFQSLKNLFFIADVRKHARYAARHDERILCKPAQRSRLIIWRINYGRDQNWLEVKEPLSAARALGYRNILCAQNPRNDASITTAARENGISSYFTDIVVLKAVRMKDLYGIIKKYNAVMRQSYVVSDEEDGEAIAMGNFFGMSTIAVGAAARNAQSGHFAPSAALERFADIAGVLGKIF